jgi:hypothetical protein
MTKEKPGSTIRLENPQVANFATFIAGNAAEWQTRAVAELADHLEPALYAELEAMLLAHRPGMAFAENKTFHDYVEPYAKRYVVQEGSAKGQHLVLCGAGPSLNEHAAEWCPQGDQVWGCNSAMTWLHENGHKVTHGFTVDQTPHMCAEWSSTPDVEYLVASTCHPHLIELLRGQDRSVTYFHNYVGIKQKPVLLHDENGVQSMQMPYEEWMYAVLYPPTVMSGAGLNAVTRALDVAQFMGFERITVLGADCCLRVKGDHRTKFAFNSKEHLAWLKANTIMHADGGHALASEATPVTLTARIDSGTSGHKIRKGHGRYWTTKPDMAISAQWLLRMARASKGRITLVGDTLPNALSAKNEAYLRSLPNFVTADGQAANIPVFAEG